MHFKYIILLRVKEIYVCYLRFTNRHQDLFFGVGKETSLSNLILNIKVNVLVYYFILNIQGYKSHLFRLQDIWGKFFPLN